MTKPRTGSEAAAGGSRWLPATGWRAIGFYGTPGPGQDGSLGPAQRAGEMAAPILGLMGGADAGIPEADVAAFEDALTAAGVEHELVTYDGAPHSFVDRRYDEFADASADAWRRVLAFIERYGPSVR